MPRLDLMCSKCEHVVEDIIVKHDQLSNGIVKGIDCPACGNDIFSVYWGNGQAPGVAVKVKDSGELFDKCKTIGEFWDRKGLEVGGVANKKAGVERIKKMRQRNKKKK